MRFARTLALLHLTAVAAWPAAASTLTLSVPHHIVAIPSQDGPTAVLRTVFTDENLLADVHLEVVSIANMPSTTAHDSEVRKLAAAPRWAGMLSWSLTRRDTGGVVALPMPHIVASTPAAETRERAKPLQLDARFDFGHVAPGDYRLTVKGGGLTSAFDFSSRTGAEREVRDVYLQDRAKKTTDYAEFRRIEMERFQRDPARIDALLSIIDRSVEQGTLAEARSDFDRAIAAYEARLGTYKPDVAARVAVYVRDLRVARDALPEYFAHKSDWALVRDARTSVYTIRARADAQVLRVLKADH